MLRIILKCLVVLFLGSVSLQIFIFLNSSSLDTRVAQRNEVVTVSSNINGAGTVINSISIENFLNTLDIRIFKSTKPVLDIAQIGAFARQVTVRVITDPIAGSGVLLGRKENTYLVLTCNHVVAESSGSYSILTSDGKLHSAKRITIPTLRGLDLAFLKFESRTTYPIIALGNSHELEAGETIYSSGFPNYRFYQEQNLLTSTESWGVRAYQFTIGYYSTLLNKSLLGGYRLGYTNDVEQGMSGGPVLDRRGRLVGINGRLKYPVQGINAYTFSDNTQPSQTLFEQIEALSWAIPTDSFKQAIEAVLTHL